MKLRRLLPALLGVVVAALPAHAHFFVRPRALLAIAHEHDAAAAVEIIQPTREASAAPGAFVGVARVRRVFRGPLKQGAELAFFSASHHVAEYAQGDRVVLFLKRVRPGQDLDGIMAPKGVPWQSVQANQEIFPLATDAEGDAIAALLRLGAPPSDPLELARWCLARLGSPSALVRAEGLRTWMYAGTGAREALAAGEGPKIMAWLRPGTALPERMQNELVMTLGVQQGPEVFAFMKALYADAELPASVRASALRFLFVPPYNAGPETLFAALESQIPALQEEAIEAALRLRVPGAEDAVAKTTMAAFPVAVTAVRALGDFSTETAVAHLRALAANHADPRIRRLAAMHARRLGAAVPDQSAAPPAAGK